MTLLEMLLEYQAALRAHGRDEAFVGLQNCIVGIEGAEQIIPHIEACFNDNGMPVDAMGENMSVVFQ